MKLKHLFGIICLICCVHLDVGEETSSENVLEIKNILQLPENRNILSKIPRPYHIIIPRRVKRNRVMGISTREHEISHHGTYEHYKHVTYQISLPSHRKIHKIRLERNEVLLSAGIQVRHYLEENQQILSRAVEHCFYHGHVKHDEWSSVALSTCDGIRGVINFQNETFVIQPLHGGDPEGDYHHVIFKASPLQNEHCGNDHGQWMAYQNLHEGEFIKRMKHHKTLEAMGHVDNRERLLKLALVVDSSLYHRLNYSYKEMVTYTIQIANTIDLYMKEIGVRVPLVYVEHWNQGDKFPVSSVAKETLHHFLEYRVRELSDLEHHTAQFITDAILNGNSSGIAIPDSVCTQRAVGINKVPDIFQPQQTATVVSHMIGHTLGLRHDEDSPCDCEDDFGCIMSSSVLTKSNYHSRQFSSCSREDLKAAVNTDVASCLSSDTYLETYKQACGNKHLERGEECDCGSKEECDASDPCCDYKTCLLKPWAQCRLGDCCRNCTFLPRNHICREKSTDCDVPESCTGESGQCPDNNYAGDGHPCADNSGYCIGGICPTLSKQCQNIWGPDADGGEKECFEQFNPTGSFNGHCGIDNSTGYFAKCLSEDVQCGLLHCQGGELQPVLGTDKMSSDTRLNINGKTFSCKSFYGTALLQLPHAGLVQDGTKCGEGGVCLNKKCVSTSHLDALTCPGTAGKVICSGNGVCTKLGTCFCHPGWTGDDCTTPVSTTSRTSTRTSLSKVISVTTARAPPTKRSNLVIGNFDLSDIQNREENLKLIPMDGRQLSSSTPSSVSAAAINPDDKSMNSTLLLIILASVVCGLFLVLIVFFLCYRRKMPSFSRQKKKAAAEKRKQAESVTDANGRLIKFGQTPSYKGDKSRKPLKKTGKYTTDEESDIGELPPPPTIISNDMYKPEKGILKNVSRSSERRESSSNTGNSSDMTSGDRESMERFVYEDMDDDDDDDAEEIQEILGQKFHTDHDMGGVADSCSFDFVMPSPLAPFANTSALSNNPPGVMSSMSSGLEPSHTKKQSNYSGYEFPAPGVTNPGPQRPPNLWNKNPSGHHRNKAVRMKNIEELLQHLDRHVIDLSPSPDEFPLQMSPSSSEEVPSSSTEEASHGGIMCPTPQSPNSILSNSTRDTYRPVLGSQWTRYVVEQVGGEPGGPEEMHDVVEVDSPFPLIHIPPPMSPLNLRHILGYGHRPNECHRETSDTPLGSQTGDCNSTNGTTNSRCGGYEKSSGYGSEHEPERFSTDDASMHTQSRSGSTSPPFRSTIVKVGPNQIRLVPTRKLQASGMEDADLQRLIQGLPRIDAGTYERSPLPVLQRPNISFLPKADSVPPELPPPPTEPVPDSPCPLSECQRDEGCGSAPCIDCSLESIPHVLRAKKLASNGSLSGTSSPATKVFGASAGSYGVSGQQMSDGNQAAIIAHRNTDSPKYSTIEVLGNPL